MAFVVRRHLAAERTVLTGLYAGNPKRVTARPTTERLLDRFQGLTLTIIRKGRRQRYHLTPLLPRATAHPHAPKLNYGHLYEALF
jgi:hypothetical protein